MISASQGGRGGMGARFGIIGGRGGGRGGTSEQQREGSGIVARGSMWADKALPNAAACSVRGHSKKNGVAIHRTDNASHSCPVPVFDLRFAPQVMPSPEDLLALWDNVQQECAALRQVIHTQHFQMDAANIELQAFRAAAATAATEPFLTTAQLLHYYGTLLDELAPVLRMFVGLARHNISDSIARKFLMRYLKNAKGRRQHVQRLMQDVMPHAPASFSPFASKLEQNVCRASGGQGCPGRTLQAIWAGACAVWVLRAAWISACDPGAWATLGLFARRTAECQYSLRAPPGASSQYRGGGCGVSTGQMMSGQI